MALHISGHRLVARGLMNYRVGFTLSGKDNLDDTCNSSLGNAGLLAKS